MKKVIKSIVFIIILIVLFNYVSKILWGVTSSITSFYEEPKKSLDIVYLGSSSAYDYFNTVEAYDQYGFTTGMLTAGSQPFVTAKYLIEESEKYQHPQLYIIDLTRVTLDFHDFDWELVRATTDTMKFSKNRIDVINKLLKYSSVDKKEYINYYFSFFVYHNNWKNINEKNYKGDLNLYKGYNLSKDTIGIKPQERYIWNNEVEELPEENKQELQELIEYIKQNNLNVLFVVPKRLFIEPENKKMNCAISMIEENNLKVINFNTLNDFDVDFDTDFCDTYHLNVYGATKYTLYFSKYLKENYDLPDHSNDPLYSSWNDEYKRFKENFGKLTGNNFDDLLLEYTK